VTTALLCPVRDCAAPLVREDGRLRCPRQHTFDVARSGYVNLLQPQDRRSTRPGDSAATLEARRRVLARGLEAPFIAAMLEMLALGPADAVLEVGCGEGDHLAAIAERFGCEGHGVDISVTAIERAARRHPRLHWVVANADRRLPYATASFRLVASITARRNAAEFRRVVRDDGAVLVVLPAPDDLLELREAILGEGRARDRVPGVVDALAPLFVLERHERIRHVARLDRATIADEMTASYRALRRSQSARRQDFDGVDVTFSRDLLLFRPPARATISP
jgi:23S rRNA (guanine745-N1)-methyltransferase